ncbi:MAG: hypothetical protein ACLGI8_05895 [Acidimicrobiia bacterium]|jgi:hypothetical protein
MTTAREATPPWNLPKAAQDDLGGAPHEHGVDGGHVDTLVEQVD